ncbi:NAD(P)-binding protein [Schizopora paradoxa]|uniref:NAD(P)-binding protein n=1 Tax=Schizopora paradoxa TaxID=27342 RepID=A0A0H2RMP6_9AGAM|nr:NAD(P)-binding protein [Schizopora paradoxa]
MTSYAVTGSSRGLGLGFVQALAADPSNTVFALVRSISAAPKLHEFVAGHAHKNVHILEADNTNVALIKSAAEEVAKVTGGTLDVLIANGSLMHHERNKLMLDEFPDDKTLEDDLLTFYKINVIGTIHVINAFLPLLRAGKTKKCIIIGSGVGSHKMARRTEVVDNSGYAMSKAALNIAAVRYASKYRKEGVIFLSMTPGFVRTLSAFRFLLAPEEVEKFFSEAEAKVREKFPKYEGAITVEQAVRDQLAVIASVTIDRSGDFVSRTGTNVEG